MRILKSNGGFSLIEVLVAMFLTMVGMLAVAGMQTSAIRTNVTSGSNTIAVQMAEEIIERVRVNSGTTPEVYNGLTTANCNALVEPAKGDCTQWLARMGAAGLPNLSGTVSVSNDSPLEKMSTITTTVTWGNNNEKNLTFATILELWGT